MSEQLTLFLPPPPVGILPDAPPEPKVRKPPRAKFCTECGDHLKADNNLGGNLCGACIPPGKPVPAGRVCGQLFRKKCCPPGQCETLILLLGGN